MSYKITGIFMAIISLFILKKSWCTIDVNEAELQYIADHLTPIECRRLIAAAHFKTYQEPNALDEAERKISKDLPCIELLNHWNSQPGEGKGETHEILERRLRQMGKEGLADWLGRTVFNELGKDLNQSMEAFHKFVTDESTQESFIAGPSLVPIIEKSDPTAWSPIDSLLYAIVVGLIVVIIFLCCKLCYRTFRRIPQETGKRKFSVMMEQPIKYETLDKHSSSESEDKFDVRNYSESKALIQNQIFTDEVKEQK